MTHQKLKQHNHQHQSDGVVRMYHFIKRKKYENGYCLTMDQMLIYFGFPVWLKIKKTVLELSTNSGDIVTDKKATVPGYGEVWYKPEAITNIFSFTEMEDKYRITYDSSIEKAFVVHLPHKKVKFMRHNGLYYHIPTYNTLKSKQTSLLLNHSSQTTKMHSIRERSI